jgi:hypothetical protein
MSNKPKTEQHCNNCGWGTPVQCSCDAKVVWCRCHIEGIPYWLTQASSDLRRIHDPAEHGQDCSHWRAKERKP